MAVVIATPVDLHKEMSVAALEVGKNVYQEKPLGLNPEQCRMLVKRRQECKRHLPGRLPIAHDPNRAASMKFVHEGGIGDVLFLQGYRHTGDLPGRPSGISTARALVTTFWNRLATSSI